jgi:hypothetical protein
MLRFGLLVLLCGVWGCGEKSDELTPYTAKLKALGHYNQTLVSYARYLKTEGMTNKANDIAQVLTDYKRDIEAIGQPKDKHIMALHNEMMRVIDQAMRKLVEPDFPTFIPNAQKAVRLVNGEMITVMKNFELLWEREGMTAPFPLSWPEPTE